MTVTRLRREMSWNEFVRWTEYYRLYPQSVNEKRIEFMLAQISAVMANSFSSDPVGIERFLIDSQVREEPDNGSEIVAFFIAHNSRVENEIQRSWRISTD